MTSLPFALAACARYVALEQRARLLRAVWADARAGTGSVLGTMLPPHLLPPLPDGPDELDDYAVDLVRSPDGVWRVARDHVGAHPGAALLEAPVLAVFLPGLCRSLLRETLVLPSLPAWWLGDRATRSLLAARPVRFCLRDGFDRDSAPVCLAGLPPSARVELQRRVDEACHRYVVSLDLVSAPVRHGLGQFPCSMRIPAGADDDCKMKLTIC